VLNDVRRDTFTWAGIKKHCVLKKKYIALYKKAVAQEAGGGTVEDGTKTRLAALEADMDGMEGWMAHDGQWWLVVSGPCQWDPTIIGLCSGPDLPVPASIVAKVQVAASRPARGEEGRGGGDGRRRLALGLVGRGVCRAVFESGTRVGSVQSCGGILPSVVTVGCDAAERRAEGRAG
jgi:hypothetical protein